MWLKAQKKQGCGGGGGGKNLNKQWPNFFKFDENYKPTDPRSSMNLRQNKSKENNTKTHYNQIDENQ